MSSLLTGLSIVLLMAPAAYHRIVFRGEASESFLRMGSGFITVATFPLALGLAGDVFVVCTKIFESTQAAAAIAFLLLATLIGLWHVIPTIVRRRRNQEEPSSFDAARFGRNIPSQNNAASAVVGLLFGCGSPFAKGIASGGAVVTCWDSASNQILEKQQRSAGVYN